MSIIVEYVLCYANAFFLGMIVGIVAMLVVDVKRSEYE